MTDYLFDRTDRDASIKKNLEGAFYTGFAAAQARVKELKAELAKLKETR